MIGLMEYGDVRKEINEKKEEIRRRIANDVRNRIIDACSMASFEIENVELEYEGYENAGRINVQYLLDDGFRQTESFLWGANECVSKVVDAVIKHIVCVQELRKDYPEDAKANDYIQANRIFEKTCVLKHNGSSEKVNLHAELCGYLKLPNTTEYGFGGGDYEIKRTPTRVQDFNRNIDTLCMFLVECIAELKAKKYDGEKAKEELKHE